MKTLKMNRCYNVAYQVEGRFEGEITIKYDQDGSHRRDDDDEEWNNEYNKEKTIIYEKSKPISLSQFMKQPLETSAISKHFAMNRNYRNQEKVRTRPRRRQI